MFCAFLNAFCFPFSELCSAYFLALSAVRIILLVLMILKNRHQDSINKKMVNMMPIKNIQHMQRAIIFSIYRSNHGNVTPTNSKHNEARRCLSPPFFVKKYNSHIKFCFGFIVQWRQNHPCFSFFGNGRLLCLIGQFCIS